MKNLWIELRKPFFILAPMDDVTDTVFREIVSSVAPADINFTEFASVDGYCSPGRGSVERKLFVNQSEQNQGTPLVAQIWGQNPDNYYQTAKELTQSGLFAGIDINMGCPEKGICRRGCCGGLIKTENRDKAIEIIQAVKKGTAGKLPVSVKTRIGFNTIDTEAWVSRLLEQDIAALTIHGRTVREMSKVPAHWGEIGKVVRLRDKIAPDTLIIGNGDVQNRQQGLQLAQQYNVDGIMIGRGIFHDLFAFAEEPPRKSLDDMFEILLKHVNLHEQTWHGGKSYEPLRKFFKVYVSAFPGASELRKQLMEAKTADETRAIVENYKSSHKTLVV
jgi:tRNA-dihydrouridine synthase